MKSQTGSPGDRRHALFLAVDGGARAALAPVAAGCERDFCDVSGEAAETAVYWSAVMDATNPASLVVGTSDSARGRRIEGEARRSALRDRVPIIAIEDFPGNYDDVSGGAASALIVESGAAAELCARKHGSRTPAIEIVAAARYDPYRERLAELRRHTAQQWAADQGRAPAVLWAGQPETDDCLRTLAVLLPVLRRHGVELDFKAHPRDAGYLAGTYRSALEAAGARYRDVTASSVHDALTAAPRLIVTQFSSVAIEAGFFGIPSLWILLPDAGAARLKQKKGYDMPPLAAAGGAALATRPEALDTALQSALTNEGVRVRLMRCFDDYFDVHRRTTTAFLQILQAYGRSEISPE